MGQFLVSRIAYLNRILQFMNVFSQLGHLLVTTGCIFVKPSDLYRFIDTENSVVHQRIQK